VRKIKNQQLNGVVNYGGTVSMEGCVVGPGATINIFDDEGEEDVFDEDDET
jgi:hypothetical protein